MLRTQDVFTQPFFKRGELFRCGAAVVFADSQRHLHDFRQFLYRIDLMVDMIEVKLPEQAQ